MHNKGFILDVKQKKKSLWKRIIHFSEQLSRFVAITKIERERGNVWKFKYKNNIENNEAKYQRSMTDELRSRLKIGKQSQSPFPTNETEN